MVVAAGTWLPFVGTEIASGTGLGDTFVGTLLVAVTTSIPELVVSIAAIRAGSVDLAIGNLLGSNIFNMAVVAVDDLAFPGGALLANVARAHAVTALAAIAMTSVVSAALVYRAQRGRAGAMTLANFLLLVIYLSSGYVLFAGTP